MAAATTTAPRATGAGGAIHNHGTVSLDHVALVRSTSAAPGWGGGGITNAGNGTALLQNVTVARNSTNARGGGIENLGDLRMLNVTVAENSAPAAQGGGVFTGANTTGTTNSIVATNTSGADCATPGGTVSSGGYNLHGDGTCGFDQSTAQRRPRVRRRALHRRADLLPAARNEPGRRHGQPADLPGDRHPRRGSATGRQRRQRRPVRHRLVRA